MKFFQYISDDGKNLKIGKIVGHAVLALVILIVLFGSFGAISAGHKGVRTQFGAVIGSINPGLYFKVPIIQGVEDMNVQTQKEQVDSEAASSDLQNVSTKIALNYNLYPDKVQELFSKIGNDYKSRIIDPAIQEAVKAATAKYTAEELVTKREAVKDEIQVALTSRLATEFIQVSQVSIVNFDFSTSFNTAIEAKVTAEQDALAAKNKLEQVKFEADQRVAQATAEAEAIKIQATAINSQGGADYVQLKAIEKWNGNLPTQMIPGGTVPFINLTK
jgi:regulator of protease activity HflC (stomatin/prohibitin superfamily)